MFTFYTNSILGQETLLTISNLKIAYSDKEKYVYSGYGITFDSASSSSFDNNTTRNAIVFCVDNWFHIGNCKNSLF